MRSLCVAISIGEAVAEVERMKDDGGGAGSMVHFGASNLWYVYGTG